MSAQPVSARAAAGAAAKDPSLEAAMTQLAIAAPPAPQPPGFLETVAACDQLAERMKPGLAQLLISVRNPGLRDVHFAALLGGRSAGALQPSLPVMGPQSEESAHISLWNIDSVNKRKVLDLPLLSFAKPYNPEALLSPLRATFSNTPTIPETIAAYAGEDVPHTAAYSDIVLPKSCQMLCNQQLARSPENGVQTLQNLVDAAIKGEMRATPTTPITAARQRYVIALAPERYEAQDWVVHVQCRTSHPVAWTNYATKESQPMIGAGVMCSEANASLFVGQFDKVFSGAPSYWRFHQMQNLQRDFVRVQAQTTQQTVVLACARLVSTVTPPFILSQKQPQPAPQPAPKPAGAAQLPAAGPQTVIHRGVPTCVISNATTAVTNGPAAGNQTTVITSGAPQAPSNGGTQALGNQTMALTQMVQTPQVQAPRQIAAAPAIPYTRITQGAQGSLQVLTQEKKVIQARMAQEPHTVDTEHAELMSFQVIMVHCPDTIDALPGYLRQLMGRIKDIKDMMLS